MLTQTEGLIGQTIAGYRLLQVLGNGGMSIVFLAQKLEYPEKQAAIKVLLPTASSTPESLTSRKARFIREAQAAQQLQHPNIVSVLGYGEEDNLPYMIMPFISGGTLNSRLRAQKEPLPLTEVAEYLNQLASVLDYAHQHGVVHRDIKPSNVLLDEQGKAYLTDFGIARFFDSGPNALDSAATALTASGEMFGTPSYMAPEQFRGEPAGPAADIYTLGILLYLLVTGQVPFEADSPVAIGMKHLNEMPPSPRLLRPELPEPAEVALLSALAKQPADRFASAGALAQAFEAGLQGQWAEGLVPPVLVVPPDGSKSLVEPSRPFPPLIADPEGVSQATDADVARPRFHSWLFPRLILSGLLLVIIGLLALLLTGGTQFFSQHAAISTSGATPKTPISTRSTAPSSSVSAANGTITIVANNNTVQAIRNSNQSLLWRFVTNGQVVPPPRVVNNVIYIVTKAGYVYALQVRDGKLLWSYSTNNVVTSPLTVANGVVYAITLKGYIYELQASNGALLAVVIPSPGVIPTLPAGVFPTPTSGANLNPTSGVTPTPTSGVTPTPTSGVTPTPTPGMTPTPTPGITPTPTSGATPAPNPRVTPTPTAGGDGGEE